jgi:UDP-glucose:(heptosyl)LPS alpha-1,3-glucosyltransferase
MDVAQREAARRALAVHGNDVALFVGHEFDKKGLKELLAAIRLMDPDVTLLVVGGRFESLAQYERLCETLGISGRVKFLGSQIDAATVFPIADVFVLPSHSETFGLVSLEAMACGVPVVMTPVGGASELIDEGANGFIVSFQPEDIARGIRSVLDGPRALLRAEALETARTYSWGLAAEKYVDLAQRCVAQGDRP